MEYKGRTIAVIVILVYTLVIREYAVVYYNYPSFHFPFFSLSILLISWWLGKQYDKVKFLSEHDALTKIYNRRYVFHSFPKLSALMDKKEEKLILFFIDINDFKLINDHYGHEVGDEVLKHFSNLLVRTTSKKDIVVRFAGDEFIIIAPFKDEKGKEIMITQINTQLKKSFDELNIDISVSIGTSVYPNDAKTLDGLLKIADQNMYKQKSQKLNIMKEESHALFS